MPFIRGGFRNSFMGGGGVIELITDLIFLRYVLQTYKKFVEKCRKIQETE